MTPVSALIDSSSRRLLALSSHVSSVVFLAETLPDARHIPNVQHPHYLESFPIMKADASTYPSWVWNLKTRTFEQAKEPASNEISALSKEAVHKQRLIARVMRLLSTARYPLKTGVEFQETVYILKRLQAERFRAAGYPEEALSDYPFVVQYADLEEIPLRQAADDILLKAQLDEDILAKTELMRMRYFRAIQRASTDELPAIEESFLREYYGNTRA